MWSGRSELLCGGNSPCEIFGAKLRLADHTFTTGPLDFQMAKSLNRAFRSRSPQVLESGKPFGSSFDHKRGPMSDVSVSMPMEDEQRRQTKLDWGGFTVLLLLVVGGAIVRSAIATRLDGFTIDEAYHIAAGVYYVRLGDFRINPEHPPLVKLWVGSLIAPTGFRASALRAFSDKQDERTFAEETCTSTTTRTPCRSAHGSPCSP